MQAIVDNEPSMIPLDVGSDYDRQFVFDLIWNVESNAKGEDNYAVLTPTNLMTCVGENDPEANVMSTLDTDIFMTTLNLSLIHIYHQGQSPLGQPQRHRRGDA